MLLCIVLAVGSGVTGVESLEWCLPLRACPYNTYSVSIAHRLRLGACVIKIARRSDDALVVLLLNNYTHGACYQVDVCVTVRWDTHGGCVY